MKTTVIYRQMVHPHSVLSSFGVGLPIIAREEPVQVFVVVVEPGDDPDVLKVAKKVALDEWVPGHLPQEPKRTRALDVG